MLFPENRFIRLAVPALVAFMPQTAFYSIYQRRFLPPHWWRGFPSAFEFRGK